MGRVKGLQNKRLGYSYVWRWVIVLGGVMRDGGSLTIWSWRGTGQARVSLAALRCSSNIVGHSGTQRLTKITRRCEEALGR